MLGYVPKLKVTGRETPIQKATLREIKELEKGTDDLIIEKMVDKRDK